ncbi:MAG: acylphosphatase [Candidatus Aminicenantes bacterium]|nr:acylphosphatase [Candidatus Aminicenantes bacterium]
MRKRLHAFISGRVQGVFFRDFTRQWANFFGITGWVRNVFDGRVEVIAEGEEEQLNLFLEKLKEGPPLARVDKVDVTWEEYRGEFADFRIRLTYD